MVVGGAKVDCFKMGFGYGGLGFFTEGGLIVALLFFLRKRPGPGDPDLCESWTEGAFKLAIEYTDSGISKG